VRLNARFASAGPMAGSSQMPIVQPPGILDSKMFGQKTATCLCSRQSRPRQPI
jgi:hypothetical protein